MASTDGSTMSPQTVGDYTVRVQQGWSTRTQSHSRWAYTIDRPGWHPFVSEARWHTAETAMRAGVRDAKGCQKIDPQGF